MEDLIQNEKKLLSKVDFMNEMPVVVYLDTNVFDGEFYNFQEGSSLSALKNFVNDGKLEVRVSNVVIGEAKKHIIRNINESAQKINGVLKKKIDSHNIKIRAALSVLKGHSNYNFLFGKKIIDNEEMLKIAIDKFDLYLKDIKYKELWSEKVSIDAILNDYFQKFFPFEETKKDEFPDAIMIYQILHDIEPEKKSIVISDDKGVKKALLSHEPDIVVISKLNVLLDALNNLNEVSNKINALFDNNSHTLQRIKNEIEIDLYDGTRVDGLEIDREGVVSGYDYEDEEVKGVTIDDNLFRLNTIDYIEGNSATITIECRAFIEIIASFIDPDFSIYDWEDGGYYNIVYGYAVENHTVDLDVEVFLDLDNDDLEITINNFELNEFTRDNKEYLTEFEYREMINRDNLVSAKEDKAEAQEEFF